MNLEDKLLYEVIDKELRWCFEHPDPTLKAEYRKGFTNGLIQAKYLIQQIADAMRRGEE